jgi:hypothetical protein
LQPEPPAHAIALDQVQKRRIALIAAQKSGKT